METFWEKIVGSTYGNTYGCENGSSVFHVRSISTEKDKKIRDINRINMMHKLLENITVPAKGQHVLFKIGKDIHIFKLKDWSYDVMSRSISVHSGQECVDSFETRKTLTELRYWKEHRFSIDGTHISFRWDEDLSVYLPQSNNRGIVFTVAGEDTEGNIEDLHVPFSNVIRKQEWLAHLQSWGISFEYIQDVVTRFFEGEPTKFNLHGPGKEYVSNAVNEKAKEHGSFFYAGGYNEVYMWGIVRYTHGTWSGDIDWSGGYVRSTKPTLFFTNSLLNGMKTDPKRGDRTVIEEEYAEFGGERFVFPFGGRDNCPQHSMIFGPKDYNMYTADVSEASDHFATTVFARYFPPGIVERYAEYLTE